ncbi:S8 family peptidase [Lysobacter brunescens]|uniref:S8 family serine peptidase n=1 Tax=Lysobacter brunescens TaxID=262323 RepID=A0ABW2Y9W7_9GAMM
MSHARNRFMSLHPLAIATLCIAGSFAGQAFAGQVHLGGLSSAQTHQRFIVKYRDGSSERRNAATLERSLNRAASAVQVRDASARGGMRAVGLRHLRRMALGSDVVVASHKLDRANAASLMRRLAADPNVEYVEVDRRVHPAMVPNDPRYAVDQWHYQAPIAGRYGINLPTAWDRATGAGIVVAVLDTGSTAHADMAGRTVAGYDFIDDVETANDGNGRDNNPADPGDWCEAGDSSSWHGTHVAGTIAAATNNNAGVAGVAYGARVQHVRVLGRCGGWDSDIADGIIWASGGAVAGVPANATPAKVLNLSLGGAGACGATYQNAINSAVGRGATIVVAAGNDGGNAANFSPSSCANVVVVGASSRDGVRVIRPDWWSSNYGAAVDIAAPGMDVMSTVNTGQQAPGVEGYEAWDGTSMATPHVAGVVALMQSARPAGSLLTPAQVEQVLKDNTTAFPRVPDQPIGRGIVNADDAVRAAIAFDAAAGGVQTYANNNRTAIIDGGTITSTIAVAGRNGNAPSNAQVSVNISHTWRGDLRLELLAPDGSVYRLKTESGSDSADNVIATYTVNLSTEALNGNWRLRVRDMWTPDTGNLNSWSIRF